MCTSWEAGGQQSVICLVPNISLRKLIQELHASQDGASSSVSMMVAYSDSLKDNKAFDGLVRVLKFGAPEDQNKAAEAVAEQVRETMKKVNDVRASLDKAHKQRQNKDKQTRDKLRNRTLGMARQQLRMTESLLKIDEQLKEDASLMTAIADAHAEIEKADSFLQQPSDLSSDATLEADTESATAKANTVLAIAQDVMDQANETAARLKKAREG